jgi:23S rRNA (guanine745-N1)-methyltransferase
VLACSVRGCHRPLARRNTPSACYVCDAGHTFDVARSGYINLLQPQDRRSASPGDAPAALEARARSLALGVGRSILDGVVAHAGTILPPADSFVVELGCGSGDALGYLSAITDAQCVGLDLSGTAIDRASRSFPGVTWVVANADRRLPLLDGTVDLILSMHARRAPDECARVLTPAGHLLVAVPAPDDLVELRALVQGEGTLRDRSDGVVTEHAEAFVLVDRQTLRERHTLTGAALHDLLAGTYRGARRRAVAPEVADAGLTVTLASDVLTFVRRT